MILCDIGNTNATFCDNGKIFAMSIKNFKEYKATQKVYFICVNDDLKQHLKSQNLFVDLENFFTLDTKYQGLGIDRVASCYLVKNGVVVDAGSAITIDVMQNSKHLGGYILPGISAMLKSYENISPRLKLPINSQISLDFLPQKTTDAISYGIIKPIITLLNEIADEKNVYFTGGDGQFLSRFFKNGVYDRMLAFRSMQNLIKQKGIK